MSLAQLGYNASMTFGCILAVFACLKFLADSDFKKAAISLVTIPLTFYAAFWVVYGMLHSLSKIGP